MEKMQPQPTRMEIVQPAFAGVDAGADISFKIRVVGAPVCDLRGARVRIVAPDRAVLKEMELTLFDGTASETAGFALKAPIRPGAYSWTVLFPAQEKEGVLHQECSAPVAFVVRPHGTGIAVWDIPSPVAFGAEFKIKAGVKCAAECNLSGSPIEIYNHEGVCVASGELGSVPWPDSNALYWAEVGLKAPVAEGVYNWTVKFSEPGLEPAHEKAADTFAFATARPPEHLVTVKVVDKTTLKPLEQAIVTLRANGSPYINRTDDSGVASLHVPGDEYTLYVLNEDYKDFQATARIAGDVAIEAGLVFAPDLGG
ncbi:MAG: hypothetical protein AB1427_04345 [Thermodesulfobacteriota bacterium]